MAEPQFKTDLFQALRRDHDLHRKLLQALAAEGDPGRRASLFEALRTEVTAHAATEEESLYATMLADPDLRESARHSVAEHKEIDDHLAALHRIAMTSAEWTERFETLRHRYLHHIEEEEAEMFPEAAAALPDAEEAHLARVFAQSKPAELERARAEPEHETRE